MCMAEYFQCMMIFLDIILVNCCEKNLLFSNEKFAQSIELRELIPRTFHNLNNCSKAAFGKKYNNKNC